MFAHMLLVGTISICGFYALPNSVRGVSSGKIRGAWVGGRGRGERGWDGCDGCDGTGVHQYIECAFSS